MTTNRTKIGAQGEVNIYRIDAAPDGCTPAGIERDDAGRPIISHSEKGHHHVLPADCEVLEHPSSRSMDVIYAIVRDPGAALIQTAAGAHGEIQLPPGAYELRISREYDPFAEQARRVAD